MKCCKCNKEIDVDINEVPAKWFGIYIMSELKKVICSECIKSAKDWGEDLR